MTEPERKDQANKFQFTIRAPAFYRILGNVQKVVLKDGTFMQQLLKEIDLHQTPCTAIKELAGMVMEMNHCGALAYFPVSDLQVLADMVHYMIRFYQTHSELPSQIASMCEYGFAARQNSRLMEIVQLNEDFLSVSKIALEFTVRTEFVTLDKQLFHPDSQFFRVF